MRDWDPETQKRITLLTNRFSLEATVVAELYRGRWQVELFFRWIKQHLRTKAFYGTSENAVKTQTWIAISVYVLVAIVRKRLKTEVSLYTMRQILSVGLFEKVELSQALTSARSGNGAPPSCNQLQLFDLWPATTDLLRSLASESGYLPTVLPSLMSMKFLYPMRLWRTGELLQ